MEISSVTSISPTEQGNHGLSITPTGSGHNNNQLTTEMPPVISSSSTQYVTTGFDFTSLSSVTGINNGQTATVVTSSSTQATDNLMTSTGIISSTIEPKTSKYYE